MIVVIDAEVGLDDARVGPHLSWWAQSQQPAALDHQDAVAQSHDEAPVMLDEQHRHTTLTDPSDQRHEVGLLAGVHAGRRLVQQQHLRVAGQRPRYVQPALIAVRELTRQPVGLPAEADEIEPEPGG